MPSRECYLPIRLSSEAPDHGNSFISELFELTLQTVAESTKIDGCGKSSVLRVRRSSGLGKKKFAGIDPNGAVSASSRMRDL